MKKKNKTKKPGFLADFQKFINRGNVLDLAVGVIIGGAFSKIVSSLVADLLMPVISLILGKVSFADLKLVLSEAVLDADGNVVTAAVTMNYGLFLQQIIDFLVIALSIFMFVRIATRLRERIKPPEKPAAAEPKPSKEELLLTEIRDILKDK